MCKLITVAFSVGIGLLVVVTNAESAWSEAEPSSFVSGSAHGIIAQVKRGYAAAAENASDASQKPFPEDQLRASAEPMCDCLVTRIADYGMSYHDTLIISPDAVMPMIREAMDGSRFKPSGML